jgi:D-aminoacyl-tRNA deacylase
MRALLQRVSSGSVSIDGKNNGSIGNGLVILLGIRNGDTEDDADYLADKCVNLRIFNDRDGKFNLSALDVNAEILLISQFTLYANCRRGRRPSFVDAAPPEYSEPLYSYFISKIKKYGLVTATGEFGARMLVTIYNEGPVTVLVESRRG